MVSKLKDPVKSSVKILSGLQYSSGLFAASKVSVSTGYDKSWIRDNIYETFGLEEFDRKRVIRTYRALLDIFLKYEWKIDYAIIAKPQHKHEYIHARFNPETFGEFHEEWGNKQNDSIGAFLFKVADLEDKGIKVIRDKNDLRILQKLVYYLKSIEYWHDKDNGMWEENEEIHASSVGACVAGLKRISKYVFVEQELIEKGTTTLNWLLPRESQTKEVDLALLSLIWPYQITTPEQTKAILDNIEKLLVKKRGVLRYIGDKYYNKDGKEAEWCFGFPWLAIIYRQLGNFNKYKFYTDKTIEAMNEKGELPELYFGETNKHNENSPLGWGQSLAIVAMQK
ncbi:MAG: glycoside hydrolase family 15 protein [Candidatus Woesearchaeota archaeon]